MTESSRLKYYTLAGFFVIGIITVLLGQVLPILSARLNLNDAQAGAFFLAQFSGSITGTLISARLARRYGFVMTTLVGLLLILVGLPGLNFHEYIFCWLSVFVYGSGLGITIPSINLLTIEVSSPDKQASSVNLINFAWGLGAICSRPFVATVSANESLYSVTIILELLVLVLAVCFFSALTIDRPTPDVEIEEESPTATIWSRPLAWLFLPFGFFVIGIESGLGGWLTTYAQKIEHGAINVNPTDLYYTFLVVGRGLASIVSRYISENVLISICSLILLTGISILVFGETTAVIGAAVAGLGTSAIFPTNMVRFTKIFGPTATKSAAPLFIVNIVGAGVLTWLTGVISTTYDSLRTGLAVFLFAVVMVILLQVVIVTASRDRTDR